MIRLRIEHKTIDFTPENDGLCWYEKGQLVGRVIIEQQEEVGPFEAPYSPAWIPVEVIDEQV